LASTVFMVQRFLEKCHALQRVSHQQQGQSLVHRAMAPVRW